MPACVAFLKDCSEKPQGFREQIRIGTGKFTPLLGGRFKMLLRELKALTSPAEKKLFDVSQIDLTIEIFFSFFKYFLIISH